MSIPPIPPSIDSVAELIAACNDRFRRVVASQGDSPAVTTDSTVIAGTHSQRSNFPAGNYQGRLYYETDRTVLYLSRFVSGAWAWVYVAGTFECTQPNLPADLGVNDFGFLAWVEFYRHILLWNTSKVWQFYPSDPGSAFIQLFAVAPTDNGWHLCDGSSVTYLLTGGGTASITLPNLASNPAHLKAGPAYSGPSITAAAVPTMGGPSLLQTVNSTGAANAANSSHLHTITLPGDPVANVVMLPYFRL